MHTDKKLFCNRFFLNQNLEETRKERDWADREVLIIWPWTLHVLQRPWQSDTCTWLPWRSSADEPPDLPQMPFPSSNSHTSPINTLRLHQILDSSLYLSISATSETWDQSSKLSLSLCLCLCFSPDKEVAQGLFYLPQSSKEEVLELDHQRG